MWVVLFGILFLMRSFTSENPLHFSQEHTVIFLDFLAAFCQIKMDFIRIMTKNKLLTFNHEIFFGCVSWEFICSRNLVIDYV